MHIAIIPIVVLMLIMFVKKIPVIGGNIRWASAIAGILSMLLAGKWNPIEWLQAWWQGIDTLTWVMVLAVVGCIYAETQMKIGTMETVVRGLSAKFGRSPRGLLVCIFIALVLAGSLLGDSLAASTVIGILTVPALLSLGLSGEKIVALLVIGGSLGSVMPPISQALFLSASLLGINPDDVVNAAYLPVGIAVFVSAFYVYHFFVKKESKFGEDQLRQETMSQVLKERYKTLIPLLILAFLVFTRSIPIEAIKFDLMTMVFNKIVINGTPFLTFLGTIPILKGFSNMTVLAITLVTILTFIFYKDVRTNALEVLKEGAIKGARVPLPVLLCTCLMIGCFNASGAISTTQAFVETFNTIQLKIGGAFSMTLLGMLTGLQSTPQNIILPFYGPALINMGMDPTRVALVSAHFSVAGQGLPPADTLTFAVCGIVGGMINKKIDPLKAMIYASFYCIVMLIIGSVLLFL